ncbi:phosphoribosylaminoimidazolesuccinocarboxamide synthase [Marisediminicola sp. LYQ134]|uniref:phosphoribosylaminoimidazolesuccinocarboxamide synthase n=1 Tax=unclassified Marisediminicola TaxID=2618316 RepID=UPI0039830F23
MTDAPVLAGWTHVYSGKVRDLYRSPEQPGRMLVVASDRVSAFDHILSPGIPGKGELLTRLSVWWFEQLDVPNHIVTAPATGLDGVPDDVAARSMLVTDLEMLPIECVVRGYLVGSGWLEYERTQSVCGVPLPEGLSNGDRLPEPIYTPAFKAAFGDHDENITFERTVELVGAERAEQLRSVSLEIFARASEIAAERGVILADTKFEFGIDSSGILTLGDEVLTSDSSRFWDARSYADGNHADSFDKQIVRNWLLQHWDPSAPDGEAPPELPADVVERTASRYGELISRLTD